MKKRTKILIALILSIIILFAIVLIFSIDFDSLQLEKGKSNIETILTEAYNDNFECINYTCETDAPAFLSDLELFPTKYYTYTFKVKSLPDEVVTLTMLSENFKKPDEWETDYLSIKYNSQAEEKLAELVKPIYDDIQVDVRPHFLDYNYNIKNLTFDEYFYNCLVDSHITIVSTDSPDTKDDKLNKLVTILKENNIEVSNINIYYVKEKMTKEQIEDSIPYKNTIVHTSVDIRNYGNEDVYWR